MSPDQIKLRLAVRDFQAAHQSAAIQELLARLSGRSNNLLSYEEIARMLRLKGSSDAGTRSIPIQAIVGTVGRYTDFTRTFLPRNAGDQERWSRVKTAFMDATGLSMPPIEVYKVGEAYFVLDGNHRVSIARQEGMEFIDAHVVEIRTNVPLTANMKPDELIIQAEHAEFLEVTGLMDLRPNVDLTVTVPGQYAKMMEQIRVREYLLEQEGGQGGSFRRAVEEWYDGSYIPLVETLRDRGLLRWFPKRTLTDLYVWIAENRAALEKQFGGEIRSDAAAADLILKRRIREGAGSWRKARTVTRYTDRLFADILVPLNGDPKSWAALEQAIPIARCEGAVLHGLHVVRSPGEADAPQALAVQAEFDRRCAEAGVEGGLVIEPGEISQKIRERASIADLVVLNVMHPPRGGLPAIRSPFRALIANSSRPLLVVPGKPTEFERALLVYDGSPQAQEALFVAAYLAEIWKTGLVLLTTLDDAGARTESQDYIRRYLEIHEVEAEFLPGGREALRSLKTITQDARADVILTGSYSGSFLQPIIGGSLLDAVLRESRLPIFICR
ncbi:MAG: universal stress protein [Bacteroidota bacterium]